MNLFIGILFTLLFVFVVYKVVKSKPKEKPIGSTDGKPQIHGGSGITQVSDDSI